MLPEHYFFSVLWQHVASLWGTKVFEVLCNEGAGAAAKVPDPHACLDRWLVSSGKHEKDTGSTEFRWTEVSWQTIRISNVSDFNDGWLVQLNGINEGTFFRSMSMCHV